jgi:flagellar protein FlbD
MILLRRLNNAVIGLNADLIERIDATPDTVITLVDGKKYVVAETPEEVVDRIVVFRANVLANAGPQVPAAAPTVSRAFAPSAPPLRLVSAGDPAQSERPDPARPEAAMNDETEH